MADPHPPNAQPDATAPHPTVDDAFLAGIVRVAAEPCVVVDLDGTIRWVNAAADALLGADQGTAVGRHMLEFVAPHSVPDAIAAFEQYTRPDRPDTGWIGPPIPIDIQPAPDAALPAEIRMVPNDQPDYPGVALVLYVNSPETALYGVIERVVAHEPIETIMRSILDLIQLESPNSVPVIAWGWDGQRYTSAVGAADAPRVNGSLVPHDLTGPTPWELRNLDGDNVVGPCATSLDGVAPALHDAALANDLPGCWVYPLAPGGRAVNTIALIVWRRVASLPLLNMSARMDRICSLITLAFEGYDARQQLRRAARTDAVTGLLNRTALHEHLVHLEQDAATRTRAVGALYCDLDNFKLVNDVHGHAVGDQILAHVADRLRARVRTGDVVARVGGDEFVIVATGGTEDEIHRLSARLLDAFVDPIATPDLTTEVGMSFGLAVAAEGDLGTLISGEELVDRADAALLRAKSGGKGRVVTT